jgi:hypothetical protein
MPDTEVGQPRRCLNGHELGVGNDFCGVCGSAVAHDGTTKPRARGRGRGKSLLLVGVLVVALVATGLFIALAQHHTPAGGQASSLETCELNLENWVILEFNAASNSGQGDPALATFGYQSPIYAWISGDVAPYLYAVNQSGQGSADGGLSTAAGEQCTSLAGQGFKVGMIPSPPAAGQPSPVFNGAPSTTTTTTLPYSPPQDTTPSNETYVPGIDPSKTVAENKAALVADGFKVQIVTLPAHQDSCYPAGHPNGGFPPGSIPVTSPSPTTTVLRGSTITLYVCP